MSDVYQYLPVERVICKDLKLGIGNIPVFIRCAFFEHFLVLYHVVDFILTKNKGLVK
jgi:hypothetical protein